MDNSIAKLVNMLIWFVIIVVIILVKEISKKDKGKHT